MTDTEKPTYPTRTDEDGVPVDVAQTADTRGRRLYIDDKPFPWATSGDYAIEVERGGPFSTLWVPIVVEGPVTITTAAHRATDDRDRVLHAMFPHPQPEGSTMPSHVDVLASAENGDEDASTMLRGRRWMADDVVRALGRTP